MIYASDGACGDVDDGSGNDDRGREEATAGVNFYSREMNLLPPAAPATSSSSS